ncbi:MAG: GNAT family N-acetyltransferase [Clostridiales bacterium]|nr:GNAT family N-acetyltransferase [Clostridiales bacterium]
MITKYLNFICTKETFTGTLDASAVPFDAYENYELITAFYDSCPECQSFPKEEYFDGDWYANWEDYVIWEDGRIAARAGIWKVSEVQWEVAGVITRPEYRNKGYSARLVAHCIAKILEQGKMAILSTAETNISMIRAAKKAGFIPAEASDAEA